MTNDTFLSDVVREMSTGYHDIGATSKAKIRPLHVKESMLILEKLGDKYDFMGYGGASDKEMNLTNDANQSWRPDAVFYRCNGINLDGAAKGAAIDYKGPFSNIIQNIDNYFKMFLSEASIVRPMDYLFAPFVMIPETAPYFSKDGVVMKLEKPAKPMIDKLRSLAETENAMDNAADLVGLCVYRLDDFDYDKIFTKEDYEKALLNYKGKISYAEVAGVKTTGRFIFNDPNLFAEKYAKMITEKFSGTSKEDSFARLFLETSVTDQVEYLRAHGKLPFVPSYIA
jgi:hypothetical protein